MVGTRNTAARRNHKRLRESWGANDAVSAGAVFDWKLDFGAARSGRRFIGATEGRLREPKNQCAKRDANNAKELQSSPKEGWPGKMIGPMLRVRIAQAIQQRAMKKTLSLSLAILAAAGLSVRAADAKMNYEKDCAKCHGPDGKGDTKMGKKSGAKDYTDPKVQAEMKDAAAFKAIKEGLKDKEGKVVMKPSEGYSDEEIKALAAFMRTFKQ
jgi:cytochrome c553